MTRRPPRKLPGEKSNGVSGEYRRAARPAADTSFHYRIFWLIGAGMFFDGYDLYVGAGAGLAVQTKFAVLAQVPQFISWTFIGMTIGALIAGFLGDRYGRRFTYQFNLVIFGLASFAAAAAPRWTG